MLAVPLPANKLEIDASLSLAAINNPEMCVVSGPTEAIAEFERRMAEKSITCRRLYTSHAFHSSMMEPILSAFEEKLRGILMHSPQRPYLSNVTGTWIKPEEATIRRIGRGTFDRRCGSPPVWQSCSARRARFFSRQDREMC